MCHLAVSLLAGLGQGIVGECANFVDRSVD